MMEILTESKPNIPIDDLDVILGTYNKPAVDIQGDTNPFPGTTTPGQQPKPFVTHTPTPTGPQPEKQYYKRGKKKGQEKPLNEYRYKPNEVPKMQQPVSIQASSIISGALLITLIDILMPMIIAGVNNWRSKIKVDQDKMKMTEKQKAELAPLGDAVVKELNLNASPTALILIALVGIYAGNLFMLRNEEEIKQKKIELELKMAKENIGKNNNVR